MGNKKYIFFDIDGTLTDQNPGGNVLPSTIESLDKLRKNGHFVAIATGRAHHLAREFIEEYGFDNAVTDGGNGLMINGELLGIEPLHKQDCLALIEECLQKDIAFAVSISNTPVFYTSSTIPFKMDFAKEIIHIDHFNDVEAIYKVYVFATVEQEKQLQTIHKLGYMRYFDVDLIVEPVDKYRGITRMVEHLGGNLEDIVVFGDGKNDLSMMKSAPTSIAMGNAIDELKEIATFVTKSNTEDGIFYACRHFGWIE